MIKRICDQCGKDGAEEIQLPHFTLKPRTMPPVNERDYNMYLASEKKDFCDDCKWEMIDSVAKYFTINNYKEMK